MPWNNSFGPVVQDTNIGQPCYKAYHAISMISESRTQVKSFPPPPLSTTKWLCLFFVFLLLIIIILSAFSVAHACTQSHLFLWIAKTTLPAMEAMLMCGHTFHFFHHLNKIILHFRSIILSLHSFVINANNFGMNKAYLYVNFKWTYVISLRRDQFTPCKSNIWTFQSRFVLYLTQVWPVLFFRLVYAASVFDCLRSFLKQCLIVFDSRTELIKFHPY